MNNEATELVATWSPFDHSGWIAYTIDSIDQIVDDAKLWADDYTEEGLVGTITIDIKPKGYVESLPEFEGW
jgi:hypothetical protein